MIRIQLYVLVRPRAPVLYFPYNLPNLQPVIQSPKFGMIFASVFWQLDTVLTTTSTVLHSMVTCKCTRKYSWFWRTSLPYFHAGLFGFIVLLSMSHLLLFACSRLSLCSACGTCTAGGWGGLIMPDSWVCSYCEQLVTLVVEFSVSRLPFGYIHECTCMDLPPCMDTTKESYLWLVQINSISVADASNALLLLGLLIRCTVQWYTV